MCRSLSLFLLIGSLSVVVSSDHSSNSIYAAAKGIRDGRTYEFDSFEGKFYETRTKNCTTAGPMCDSCESLFFCIQTVDGFIKEKLEDCAPGTCSESAAACTTGPNLACNDTGVTYIFTCHQMGIFPDPFDCQKYHFCLPDETEEGTRPRSVVKKCSGTYYYDPKTTLCRKKLYNNICPTLVPPCVAVGQSGVIPNNPAMYYICFKGQNTTGLFPNLFYCPDGMVFDSVSRICIDSSPAAAIGGDGRCPKVGKFYFPFSCLYYYECNAVGQAAMSRPCENKTHFDHVSQKCVDFTCEDLEYK